MQFYIVPNSRCLSMNSILVQKKKRSTADFKVRASYGDPLCEASSSYNLPQVQRLEAGLDSFLRPGKF